jgi:hypothetical protein
LKDRRIVRSAVGAAALLFAAASALAQVEFRRAYRGVRPDSVAASFANDTSFRFMSRAPFIEVKHILGATTGYEDGMGSYVEITISAEALKKINELAASNAAAIDSGAFDNVVGIATVVDGEPVTITQGVHQQLPTPVIRWFLGNFQLSREDAMAEAEAWAEHIRRGTR